MFSFSTVVEGASRRRGHGKKKQCPETDTETLTPRRSSTLASMVLTAEYRAAASRGGSPVARMRREAQASLSSLTRLISSDRPFHVGLAQRQESTRSICRGADCRYVVTVYSKQPPASQPYTGHLYGRSYDLVCHWFNYCLIVLQRPRAARDRIHLITVRERLGQGLDRADDVIVWRCGGTLTPSLERTQARLHVVDETPTSSPGIAAEELGEAQAGWARVRARRDLRDLLERSRLQEDEEDCRAMEMEQQLELDQGHADDQMLPRVAGG